MDRAVSAPDASDQRILRFGQFELDLHTRELRRAGLLVKIQHQPFKVLALLTTHAGELVTREELREQIWGGDTYVDFDQGLNFCIKQIRSALGDQADTPRYVETLPRRGYRFIAPIEAQPRPLVAGTVRLMAGERDEAPHDHWTSEAARAPLPLRAVDPPRRTGDRPGRHPGRRSRAAWIAGGLTVAASLGLAGSWIGHARKATHEPPSFQRLTFRRGLLDAARFTEGGEVVYAAAWEGQPPELFVTRAGQADTRTLGPPSLLLAGTAGPEAAVRHVDGAKRGILARMPLAGGPPRDIADNVLAADWSRDGRVFAAVRLQDGVPRLEMPLGRALAGALAGDVIWMRLSPGGDRVAFLEHPVPGDDQGSVVTVDSEGRRRVLSSGWASLEGLAWSPSGGEVWFTGTRLGADSALWAVDLEGRERLVYRGPGRLVVHDVAPGGRALLSRKSLRMELRARLADDAAERDLAWFDLPLLTDISADGRSVVFGESGEAGGAGYSIFMRAGSAPPVRLGGGRPFTLSPDGQWLASIPVSPPFNVVLIPTGPGQPRIVRTDALQNIYQVGWLPDGAGLVLAARQPERPQRIFVQPLGGGVPRPVTPERVTARQVVVSPDGRWVVGVERGRAPALYPLGGGEPRPIAGAEPEDQPLQWSADGRTLFLQRGRVPMQVHAVDVASGARRLWRELAPDDRAGVLALTRIVLTRDARAYAFGYGRNLSELYLVDGLQ